MESRSTLSLNNFSEWLNWVEQFPFVPRWQWTAKSREIFSQKLSQAKIRHCEDAYGNILLGAKTLEEWFSKIIKGHARLVLQSHLDHPGAVVLHVTDWTNTNKRYRASVQGGLHSHLKGNRFFLYDRDGRFVEEVLIDSQVKGFQETWISFLTKQVFNLPGYLRGPHQNSGIIFEEGFLEGWGLDNHVGSASILGCFSQNKSEDILGLLTRNEEIGMMGLRDHLQEAEKLGVAIQEWPLMLSVEVAPEYPELEFTCGRGARWRSADKKGRLTDFMEIDPVALQKGSCEAGEWVRHGGRSACLVIPCEFAHNGMREKEWRAERVAMADVISLLEKLEKGIANWKGAGKNLRTEILQPPKPAEINIRVHDHLEPLRKAASQTENYVDCLQNVLPAWNALHARFGLPALNFAQSDWEYWRKCLSASKHLTVPISEKAVECLGKVKEWSPFKNEDVKEIGLHLFAGAPFNASNQPFGIALSIEKIREKDLRRILIHELTHALTNSFLDNLDIPPLMKMTLGEGLACKATIDILGISSAQALGFNKVRYMEYESNASLLASYLRQWLLGDLFEIQKGRHEVIKPKNLPHPFVMSRENVYQKYGYFIGLKFLQAVSRLDTVSMKSFDNFLQKMEKGICEEEGAQNYIFGGSAVSGVSI